MPRITWDVVVLALLFWMFLGYMGAILAHSYNMAMYKMYPEQHDEKPTMSFGDASVLAVGGPIVLLLFGAMHVFLL